MNSITAELTSANSFHCIVSFGKHELISDEPENLGGSDKGPNPMELLMGSLAACTVMTIKIYLDQKNISFSKLNVEVNSRIDRIENAAILSDEERTRVDSGKLRRIHKHIYISGDFTPEQLDKIAVIAGKCPVNKLLRKSSYITDEVSAI